MVKHASGRTGRATSAAAGHKLSFPSGSGGYGGSRSVPFPGQFYTTKEPGELLPRALIISYMSVRRARSKACFMIWRPSDKVRSLLLTFAVDLGVPLLVKRVRQFAFKILF